MNYLLLISLLLPTSSFAQDEVIVNIQDRRPEMFVKDGKPFGPIIDIVNAAFKESDLSPKYISVPWARSLHEAKSRSDVFLIRHSMKKDRRAFLSPIIYGHEKRTVHFFKKRGSNVTATSLNELKNFSIGYRRSSFYFPSFSTERFRSKYPVSSDKQLIKMLMSGRFDIIIFNHKNTLLEHLKEMKLNYSEHLEEIKYHHTYLNPRFISIPKGSSYQKYYRSMNCEIYKLRKNGGITSAFKAHKLSPLTQIYSDKDSLKQEKMCLAPKS